MGVMANKGLGKFFEGAIGAAKKIGPVKLAVAGSVGLIAVDKIGTHIKTKNMSPEQRAEFIKKKNEALSHAAMEL